MAILFFDTEMSDMVRRDQAPGPRQPHIVQLAALFVEHDSERSMCTLVRPEGWTISPGAERVHGISTEQAAANGVPIREAVGAFHDLAVRADTFVAHNIEFDLVMMLSEYARLGSRTRSLASHSSAP